MNWQKIYYWIALIMATGWGVASFLGVESSNIVVGLLWLCIAMRFIERLRSIE